MTAIGYAAIVPHVSGAGALFSHHLYRVVPKPGSPLTARFLCHMLNSPQVHDVVSGYANGTTVNMLPMAGLQQPLVVIPPPPLVQAFDRLATQVQLRQELVIAESKSLSGIRDALLPKLVYGELRIRDAERIVADAV